MNDAGRKQAFDRLDIAEAKVAELQGLLKDANDALQAAGRMIVEAETLKESALEELEAQRATTTAMQSDLARQAALLEVAEKRAADADASRDRIAELEARLAAESGRVTDAQREKAELLEVMKTLAPAEEPVGDAEPLKVVFDIVRGADMRATRIIAREAGNAVA